MTALETRVALPSQTEGRGQADAPSTPPTPQPHGCLPCAGGGQRRGQGSPCPVGKMDANRQTDKPITRNRPDGERAALCSFGGVRTTGDAVVFICALSTGSSARAGPCACTSAAYPDGEEAAPKGSPCILLPEVPTQLWVLPG